MSRHEQYLMKGNLCHERKFAAKIALGGFHTFHAEVQMMYLTQQVP